MLSVEATACRLSVQDTCCVLASADSALTLETIRELRARGWNSTGSLKVEESAGRTPVQVQGCTVTGGHLPQGQEGLPRRPKSVGWGWGGSGMGNDCIEGRAKKELGLFGELEEGG